MKQERDTKEHQKNPKLTPEEQKEVDERRAGSSLVLHEVVREQGDEELDRPALSLLLSGVAAGVAITFSLVAEASLKSKLPDEPWASLVVDLGYTVGFIVVVLGRLQLFTESTVTPVLPVAVDPSLRNILRLFRLWALVLVANLLGTLMTTWLAWIPLIVTPELQTGMAEIAQASLDHSPTATLMLGIPSGFLIASIAWILPNARGSEIWVVFVITYVVAICGFSHVVAGSAKAWELMLTGAATPGHVIFGILLPSLIGNILGGTGLFAVLAHGQVRHEL